MTRPAVCLSVSTFPPQPGGVATAAARLAHYLSPHFDTHVIVPEARAGDHGTVESSATGDATVHRVYHDDPPGAAAQHYLRQVMRELDDRFDFHLFHGFFLTAAVPCVYAARRRRRPCIASPRGSDVAFLLEQPVIRPVLLAALKSVTWIASINQACLDRIAEEVPVAGRSSVIRPGVASVADQSRWRLDAARRGVVGTVGEFRTVKDIPLLIRAYATVPAQLRRQLYLAGFFSDADEAAWSDTLTQELGIARERTLTGEFPPDRLPGHLARMHVYVQSSANEGGPNVVLEAAARGIPIVATAVGGMREVLTGGESALLVPHGERDALGAAITRVLEDDRLAASLSAGALAVAERWSVERERRDWLALYEALLHQRPPA